MKPRMTKWFDGSKFVPAHVGEYNASFADDKTALRWWDGKQWSAAYWIASDMTIIKLIRKIKFNSKANINFRGLKDKP